ncbi:hypothetical protein BC834DRAFT_900905 [Gloeopeniophorella convolvens]|nr:hypothetical protein BC834DRAFT_900905 [Gloeopeniophorella convolvens]
MSAHTRGCFPPGMWQFGQSASNSAATNTRNDLAPPPVPHELQQLRTIVAEISSAADYSPYIQPRTKQGLSACRSRLDAECEALHTLRQLAHKAADGSANALDGRIRELKALREKFVDARQMFKTGRPSSSQGTFAMVTRGRMYEGMYTGLKPLFDDIDKYYGNVNVSLRAEQHRLKNIRSSLHVTPDDKLRWEHIRDACQEASSLLVAESPPPLPHAFQPANNKVALDMQALAHCVAVARERLRITQANIAPLAQQPQFDLLRLKSEYELGEKTCRQRITEVMEFAERYTRSFVEVPPVDDFRDRLLPPAAASSAQALREVASGVRAAAHEVRTALPHLANHFTNFDYYLPAANASVQRMYQTLDGLAQPLMTPDDPVHGVMRALDRVHLREEQQAWKSLERQWAGQS